MFGRRLDTDYPESKQFHVSKGCVRGSVLGAAVAVRCSCCGARARCKRVGACARCFCVCVCVKIPVTKGWQVLISVSCGIGGEIHFSFRCMYAGGDGVYQVAVANEAPLDKIRKTYLL